MLGTVIATVAVTLLVMLLFRGLRRRCFRRPLRFRRRGRRFALDRLFARLGTTPGQEAEIERALDDLARESRPVLHGELRQSRRDLGQALREDDLDAERLGDLFARHDATLDQLRKAAVGALSRIHEALEPQQRVRLADMLLGGARWRGGGPYRSNGAPA
jgi:uncharacterized membrane protein YccC